MSTLATPQTSTATWNIDPAHSVAEFKVKHMMISNVKGQFAKVSGVLTLDESELTNSRVEALIETASIETRDAQRDAHLKSARRPARRAPEERRLLARGEVSDAVLQVEPHQPCPRWRASRRGRPDHSGRHAQGGFFRRRADATFEGSLG